MLRHLGFACYLFLAVPLPSAWACRYSVRDTGFVDLGSEPYRLTLHTPAGFPSDALKSFEHAAAAVLLDANITFSSKPAASVENAGLTLHGPDQRSLALATATSLPGERSAIVELLERAALSPFRARLHDDLLRAYAVLVLVEGLEPAANRRARKTLEEATAAITRILPGMPKPVDVPPQILTLPLSALSAESVLVWGLGMDPKPVRDPRVAIVFGRGRRVGDPLEGALITRTVLQDRLAIIGQDCECDLDRSSLQGPVIPARWDNARQRTAASALGFDPENPLIRAEISRIVLKGPVKPGGRKAPSGAFDSLALGYSEERVDAINLTSADSAELASADPVSPVAAQPAAPESGAIPVPPRTYGAEYALWTVLSGFGLVVTLAGAWLFNRSRRDRA